MATTDPVSKFNTLTDRHKEVLRLVCKGTPYKKIGEKLFIGENTVKTHMGNIYEKLGLTHLERSQRIAIIHEIYCPLLKESPTTLVVVEREEEPEPVSPEVERIVEEDENALMRLDSPEIIEGEVVELPPRRRSGCVWGLIGVIVGGGLLAAYLFFFGGGIPGGSTPEPEPPGEKIEEPASPPEIPVASDTPVVVVVTATDLPASETPIPSETPLPTATTIPSATPDPITPSGSVLAVGEWWKGDGVWIRVSSYQFGDVFPSIRILIELWNKTDDTLLFSWNTSGNFSLKDNTGHNYPLTRQYTNEDNGEKVDAGELLEVDNNQLAGTVLYQDDALYNADVTELILTVTDFSRIDQAQFRISLNK